METITKSVSTWRSVFKELSILLNSGGYKKITESIKAIKKFEKGELPNLEGVSDLLNIFYQNGIRDLKPIRHFLKELPLYSFDSILTDLSNIETEYGITKVAFITRVKGPKTIETFTTWAKSRKVYTPRIADDLVDFSLIDLKTNGLNVTSITSIAPFIVDSKDFTNRESSFNERVMYVEKFRLKSAYLPTKEEMNLVSIAEEKASLFSTLIDYLIYESIPVNIILGDPNSTYHEPTTFNIDELTTIRSDGTLLDESKSEILPSANRYFGSILVQNANFVLRTSIASDTIKSIDLIIDPDYIAKIYNSNNRPLIDKLNKLQDINVEKKEK